jgi:hypothetical protein
MLSPQASLLAVFSGLSVVSAGFATAQTQPPVPDSLPASPSLPNANPPSGNPPRLALTRSMPPAEPGVVSGDSDPLRTPSVPSETCRPHRGLYLSARLGAGDLRVSFADYMISGMTSSLGLAIGIAAANNLVVFSELYAEHVFSPASNYNTATALDLYGFGPGLKYYFTPANLFLSSSLLFSLFHMGGDDGWSHWGVGGRFSMGKDWWVSPSWSLGLAGEVMWGHMQGNRTFGYPGWSYEYSTREFSLLLSGSFSYPPGDTSSSSPDAAVPGALPGDSALGAPSAYSAAYHTHDGFYLSARLGLGWLWLDRGGDMSGSGLSTPFGLSAGIALTNSLVLFGEFYRALVPRGVDGDFENFDLQGFGPGLKYYLMPINIFFSGSLLLSRVSLQNGYGGDARVPLIISETSPWGVTGRISAGKEWWVSADWGLGIAGEFLLGRMSGSDPIPTASGVGEDRYTVKGFSLLASASFN